MATIIKRVKQLIKYVFARCTTSSMVDKFAHCLPRTETDFILEVCLVEHCNLNCAGCDHFSPLAEPEFADYESTERDFARLSFLFHGHARQIRLMGGEPLLHPDLVKFLKMARKYFPDAAILIVTNGLLLLNQSEEFWLACKENNIIIRPTKYPISLDFKAMEKCAADHGVEYSYYTNTGKVLKKMDFCKLDVKGQQDSRRNFMFCGRANTCVNLHHGRLYTCPIVPMARHFNKAFGENMEDVPENSIDIYQANSSREILEFLSKPILFCRYCNIEMTRWKRPWRQSERTIEEWT